MLWLLLWVGCCGVLWRDVVVWWCAVRTLILIFNKRMPAHHPIYHYAEVNATKLAEVTAIT
jgi:hypothetical protein